jgi:hypothetical protein
LGGYGAHIWGGIFGVNSTKGRGQLGHLPFGKPGAAREAGSDLLRAWQCILWQRFSQVLCKILLFVWAAAFWTPKAAKAEVKDQTNRA